MASAPLSLLPLEPGSVAHTANINATISYFDAKHLLQNAYDAFCKHQCYASQFEVAYWQEHRKCQELVEENKTLALVIEQLRARLFEDERCTSCWEARSGATKQIESPKVDTDIFEKVELLTSGAGLAAASTDIREERKRSSPQQQGQKAQRKKRTKAGVETIAEERSLADF
ncbi:hypothetical protein SCUP234_12841 [Seiridium cupressi]